MVLDPSPYEMFMVTAGAFVGAGIAVVYEWVERNDVMKGDGNKLTHVRY